MRVFDVKFPIQIQPIGEIALARREIEFGMEVYGAGQGRRIAFTARRNKSSILPLSTVTSSVISLPCLSGDLTTPPWATMTVFNRWAVTGCSSVSPLVPSTVALNTVIVAQGGVVRSPDKKGKEITLDVTVDKGRIEDLMRLAVKTTPPPLTGAINFRTRFDLPPGKGDLADRLNLNGKFDVEQGQFTSPEVTAKIETLSRKAQGQPENKDAGSSVSQLKGNFVLDNGVITFGD